MKMQIDYASYKEATSKNIQRFRGFLSESEYSYLEVLHLWDDDRDRFASLLESSLSTPSALEAWREEICQNVHEGHMLKLNNMLQVDEAIKPEELKHIIQFIFIDYIGDGQLPIIYNILQSYDNYGIDKLIKIKEKDMYAKAFNSIIKLRQAPK